MTELANEQNDRPIDWLYAQAHQFPLLSAEQEQAFDQAKWRAVEHLQALLLNDTAGRAYLKQWATNLLKNPPTLDSFNIREYYNLLRREHAELLKNGKHRSALIELCDRLSCPPSRDKDMTALMALRLPCVLVTGLAEVLLYEPEPREMAAALLYWRSFWPEAPDRNRVKQRPNNHKAIRASLDDYYVARSKLVNHNLRLVYSIAGRLNNRGLPYEDLVQGGNLGLIRAAEKYHHERGYRFSTYAYNWINQSTRQLIADMQGVVRYPSGVNEQISRMHRERMQYLNTTGTEPSLTHLAQRLEMEPQALRRLQQVTNLAVTLDTSVNSEDGGLSLAETLPGGAFQRTAKEAEDQSLNRCLIRKLEVLQPAEQQVVKLRWGLEHSPPLTRDQIADHMQVSSEWVRRLEVSALDKLREDKGLEEAYRDYLAANP